MTQQAYSEGSSAALASQHLRSDAPVPWAASPEAHSAAEACQALMAANRKRSITVQWMPSETDKGCRFEIIGVSTGALLGEVLIDEAGRVVLRYA